MREGMRKRIERARKRTISPARNWMLLHIGSSPLERWLHTDGPEYTGAWQRYFPHFSASI
jgi:hypothetical protein